MQQGCSNCNRPSDMSMAWHRKTSTCVSRRCQHGSNHRADQKGQPRLIAKEAKEPLPRADLVRYLVTDLRLLACGLLRHPAASKPPALARLADGSLPFL